MIDREPASRTDSRLSSKGLSVHVRARMHTEGWRSLEAAATAPTEDGALARSPAGVDRSCVPLT